MTLESLMFRLPEVIISIISLVFLWSIRTTQAKSSFVKSLTDTITAQTEEIKAKNQAIEDLMRSKNSYKHQYLNLQSKVSQLQSELKTYHKFHEHKPLIEVKQETVVS